MSYEAFETVASCDMRSPDGIGLEFGRSGEGHPRLGSPRGWVSAYLYAHDAIELAAQSVEGEPMRGITGDHPDKREALAKILRACVVAVKELAADSACDGALTDEDWSDALDDIIAAVKEAKG